MTASSSVIFLLAFSALVIVALATLVIKRVTLPANPGHPGASQGTSEASVGATDSIYVDQSHPLASDDGAGTLAEPLQTIRAAIRRAEVRNRKEWLSEIIIAPGIYRESLELPDREEVTDAPIRLKGAVAEQVVISGSDIWQDWVEEDGIYRQTWPHRWGLAPLPQGWEESYAAEQLMNNPVIRRREMIFIDGRPLTQVMSFKTVSHLPGSFFVSESESTVYMNPPEGVLLPQAVVEVAVRPHLFIARNRQNVSLEGLTFQHASSPMEARAVSFSESSGIEVVDSRFLWNSWLGLGFFKSRDVVVRRSIANHNGAGGIGAFQVDDMLFEDTETSHNNWRGIRGVEDTPPGREIDKNFVDWASGQKFFRLRGATFRRHRSIGNMTGGLWFDFDNADVTLENLVITGNRTHGIFIEASQGPFALRDSLICGNESGLLITNSKDGEISHNVIGGNTLAQLLIVGTDSRFVNNVRTGQNMSLSSEHWAIFDNTFAAAPQQLWMATSLPAAAWGRFVQSLESDRNLWLHGQDNPRLFRISGGKVLDLEEWRSHSGQDNGSKSNQASWYCATD